MHSPAAIVAPLLERTVGVDADPDVEHELLVDRALDGLRRLHRVARLVEGREEPVPGVIDDLARVVAEDRAERVVVPAHDRRPLAVVHRVEELGGLHDVGEEERLADFPRRIPAELGGDALGVPNGLEPLEARGGRLELPESGLLVLLGPGEQAEPFARPSDVVGGARRVPEPAGLAEVGECLVGLAELLSNRADGEGGDRLERRSLVHVGSLGELARVRLRAFDSAVRKRDLHRSREQTRACGDGEPVVGERPRDRDQSALGAALGETEQREPGLGRRAVLVRLAEARLCRVEVAEPQTDVAELVERRAGDGWRPLAKLVAGAARLVLGLAELALELEDLCVVHAAHAGVAREASLGAEVVREVGPFPRPVVVRRVAAHADRVAVDGHRRELVELAADRGRACLVEEGSSLGDVAEHDERHPAPLKRAHLETPVAEPAADVLGPTRQLERPLGVVGDEREHALLEGEVAVHARLGLVRDEPLGPAEPSVRDGGLVLRGRVVVDEENRRRRRADRVVLLDVRGVGALEGRDRLDRAAGPEGRVGEEEQILAAEWILTVGLGEKLVGRLPVAPGRRVARGLLRILGDAGHCQLIETTCAGSAMPFSSTERVFFTE